MSNTDTLRRVPARCVLELLAVLNRDGGHYYDEHGLEAACRRGTERYYELVTAADAALAALPEQRPQAPIPKIDIRPCAYCHTNETGYVCTRRCEEEESERAVKQGAPAEDMQAHFRTSDECKWCGYKGADRCLKSHRANLCERDW